MDAAVNGSNMMTCVLLLPPLLYLSYVSIREEWRDGESKEEENRRTTTAIITTTTTKEAAVLISHVA